jgi:hypothetical protein
MDSTVNTFKRNIESVKKLINFDREVLDLAIEPIKELHETLMSKRGITNDQLNGKRTLDILNSIRTNDSLKSRYSIINNQAIILLVSYFSSAVADLFRTASKVSIDKHRDKRVLDEELKLKVSELLLLGSSVGDTIGDLLISKSSISFQDMKSIRREFNKYFGIEIQKDITVNNIILGHACRHSIAHEGGIVNARIINQIKGAKPREIKEELNEGTVIEFSEDEINILSNSMLKYVENLSSKVNDYNNETI